MVREVIFIFEEDIITDRVHEEQSDFTLPPEMLGIQAATAAAVHDRYEFS